MAFFKRATRTADASAPPSGSATRSKSGTIPKLWDDEPSGPESTAHTARQQSGRPRFTVIAGHHAGEVIAFPDKSEFYIGRGREADIRDDEGAQRRALRR